MLIGLCIGGPRDKQIIKSQGLQLFISRVGSNLFRYKYISLDYLAPEGEKQSFGFWVPEDLKNPELKVIQALYDNYLIDKERL